MNNYKHVCMLLLGWLTCIVLFSACKKDVYDPNKNEPAKDIFDFATTVDKSLDIDYGMKGNKAVFEVFTEDPVILENGKAKKKENVKSIAAVMSKHLFVHTPVLSICQQLARKFTCIRRIIFYRPAWKSRSKIRELNST